MLKHFTEKNLRRLWVHPNNPLSLKILAASFIISAMNPLVGFAGVWVRSLSNGGHLHASLLLSLFLAIGSLRVFIGVGLLRRSNAGRIFALIWAFLALMMIPVMQMIKVFIPSRFIMSTHPATDYLFGLMVPFNFTLAFHFHNLGILAWGCYLLNKRSIRNLFRSESKVETA